jgi:protein-disulfide isomerase
VALTVMGSSALAVDPQPPIAATASEPGRRGSRESQRREKAAAVRVQAERARIRSRLRLHQITAGGLVVAAAVIGAALGAGATQAVAAVPAGVTTAGGVIVGEANARHHLVVFEDPQCPVCGEFEKTSGAVVQHAVAAGTVSVEYRMRSFLGPESVRAVAALGAATDEGKFEALRETLFAHQPPERTGGYTIDQLIDLGAQAGLTDTAYVDKVKAQTYAPWAKRVDDQASRDGNVGTPELRLDGKTLDNAKAFNPTTLAALLS